MALFEIKIAITQELAEQVDTALLETGSENWSVVEDVIAKAAWLTGIFESEEAAQGSWAELKPNLPAALQQEKIAVRELIEAEWRDSYKAHFRAWQFGRLHWVPVWERESFKLPEGEEVLWLDPGMAFGTGNHETTRLCVERLVSLASAGCEGPVVDVGCGSGILALSAVKLGCDDVIGFDNDPEAVRVSWENAAQNGLKDRVRFWCADVERGLAGINARIVLANILADVLIRFARPLVGAVAPGGSLVLSGILATERESVRAAFAAVAPQWPQDSRVMGEWCDVVLSRPANT